MLTPVSVSRCVRGNSFSRKEEQLRSHNRSVRGSDAQAAVSRSLVDQAEEAWG